MKPAALEFLRSPRDGATLRLEIFEQRPGEIVQGRLVEADGYWYPILDELPILLHGALRPELSAFERRFGLRRVPDAPASRAESSQAATSQTFSDKWRRFRRYGLEPEHQTFLFDWYRKKFGRRSREDLDAFYAEKRRVLEIGPGSGFHAKYMAEHGVGTVVAVDISDAARTTHENAGHLPNVHVVQADVMALPLPDRSFDFAVADGVLHHTPDTRAAVEALYRKVEPGGQLFFYLYKRMGALREFSDDHLRAQLSKLPPEECYRACEALTELGRELSRLGAKITLEKPIELLGIPAGTHDVQRLFYYNVLKCFWNEAFDFETNNMVNFDWYHPKDAHRHAPEEIEGWLRALGVEELAFHDANPNGNSVLLRRPTT